MSYCTKCGSELREGDKFCPQCGAGLRARQTLLKPRKGNHDLLSEMNKAINSIDVDVIASNVAAAAGGVAQTIGKAAGDAAQAAASQAKQAVEQGVKAVGEGATKATEGAARKERRQEDAPVPQQPEMAASKITEVKKEESLVRCPACGEVLEKHAMVCSTCGFVIRDVADGSIAALAEKLEVIERTRPKKTLFVSDEALLAIDKKKADVIRNYPIPNTYEDLAEFMAMAKGNSSVSGDASKAEKIIADAWTSKFDQAFAKAQRMFGDREEFAQFEGMKQEITHQKRRAAFMERLPLIVIVGLFLLIYLINYAMLVSH